MGTEPSQLRRGKAFHRLVQHEWHLTAEGSVKDERVITKPSGRRGRIDIRAAAEGEVAVVEIKASDWNRMTQRAVRRNGRRQIRQIRSYIEAELLEANGVSPGIIFSTTPDDPERKALIEQLFGDEFIAVVWHDG